MPTFPSLTTILPTFYREEESQYIGGKTEYQDGGDDRVSYSDTPVRRWTIIYENLTTSEAAQFDTLAADCKYNRRIGSILPLNFTPRGASALVVFIDEDGFRHTRTKSWIHRVEIKLIKNP